MIGSHSRGKAVPILAVVTVVVAAGGFYAARRAHAALVLSHVAGGRATGCSLVQSFEGDVLFQAQTAAASEQWRSSRQAEKDGNGFARWDTPQGSFWMPAATGADLLYDLAEQQRNIYGTGEMAVHSGDVVLDCGANIGVYTRKSLNAGAKLVVAIEPAPENVECLRRNFAREIEAGRVIVYPKGVWNRDDVLTLNVDPKNSARDSFVVAVGPGALQVPLTTIDKLVAELHLARVDQIKMDIEGAEQKAIAGARDTIWRFHPRMALCVYHQKDDPVAVPRMVQQIHSGYRTKMTCLATPEHIIPEVALFY